MIVAELRVVPVGAGSSMEKTVDAVREALEDCKVEYEVGAVGTTLQVENLDDLMETVQCCQEAAMETAPRVVLNLTIDQRSDEEEDMESLKETGRSEAKGRGGNGGRRREKPMPKASR